MARLLGNVSKRHRVRWLSSLGSLSLLLLGSCSDTTGPEFPPLTSDERAAIRPFVLDFTACPNLPVIMDTLLGRITSVGTATLVQQGGTETRPLRIVGFSVDADVSSSQGVTTAHFTGFLSWRTMGLVLSPFFYAITSSTPPLSDSLDVLGDCFRFATGALHGPDTHLGVTDGLLNLTAPQLGSVQSYPVPAVVRSYTTGVIRGSVSAVFGYADAFEVHDASIDFSSGIPLVVLELRGTIAP